MNTEKQLGNIDYLLTETRAKQEELKAQNETAEKQLKETENQIKNAQGQVALFKFEIEKAAKELEKSKKDSAETLKVEKEKLVAVELQRQEAEKEFGNFLVSVKEEKQTLTDAQEKHAKDLEKLEDAKRTNQFLIDEKKKYSEDAKRDAVNLETTRTRAEADLNGMKALERNIIESDEKLKRQQESVASSQLALDRRNNDLNQREQGIQLKEAQLATREVKVVEDETKVGELLKVQEEKETLIYKLEESLKLRGIELPKAPGEEQGTPSKMMDDGGKTVSWKSKKPEKPKKPNKGKKPKK